MGVIVRQKLKGKGKPWWVFVAHNKRRTSRKMGDKEAAEEVASEIRARLKLGQLSFEEDKPATTFKTHADDWIDITVPATCKESTQRDYRDILNNHVLPVFGCVPVHDVNRGIIKKFLLGKANDGYAISTVTHMRDVISGVLNDAVDDEIILANPSLRLGKFLSAGKKTKQINALSAKDLTKLLNTVAKHYSNHYTLFLLLARTGMRISEAVALQWGDINFKERYIEVQRGLVRGKISTPKSGKTRRVDISPQLVEALKRHKQGFSLSVAAFTLPQYVFTNREGNLIDKDNWRRRVFAKVIKKAEVPKIRIHDLRHTYATTRIAKGDNIGDVSNQLGHHSVKLTLDTYYHWIPGKKKSEVDALDDPALKLPSAPQVHPTPKIPLKKGLAINA